MSPIGGVFRGGEAEGSWDRAAQASAGSAPIPPDAVIVDLIDGKPVGVKHSHVTQYLRKPGHEFVAYVPASRLEEAEADRDEWIATTQVNRRRVEEAEARLATATKALEFYANDEEAWHQMLAGRGGAIAIEGPAIAQRALAAINATPKTDEEGEH